MNALTPIARRLCLNNKALRNPAAALEEDAMNVKVLIVILAGISAMIVLFFIPPWKAYDSYVGHFRIDSVAWLEFDFKRFCIEQALIAAATLFLAAKVWRNKK
jgi:hypothetical protein